MELSGIGRRRRPSVVPEAGRGTDPSDSAGRPRSLSSEHWLAPRGALGQLLLCRGYLSLADLQFALLWQRALTPEWPVRRLGSLVVKAGLLTGRQVIEVLAEQRRVLVLPPGVELPRQVPAPLRGLFPADLLRRHGAVPLYLAGRVLVVGMQDPQRRDRVAALQAGTRLRVEPALLLQLQVQRLLRTLGDRPQAAAEAATIY